MEDTDFFNTESITADHVAKAAGVSRWTVARAFKKDASISARTRDKVLAVAEKLGYVPDLLASSLASDKSNLVALLIDDFTNPHKLVLLERLTRILRIAGWGTLLVNMLDDADAASALLSASQRRVDACVMIGTRFSDRDIDTALGARRVKKLVVFARMSTIPNTITIACDDEIAMKEIATYLHEKGYKKPLFVAGPADHSATVKRKDSFSREWQQLGGEQPDIILASVYDSQKATERVVAALDGKTPKSLPDVLVCENDILAIGAVDAIRYRLGLRVPEDIAVTGFDDIPLVASPAYEMTSYRQPITLMANTLLKVLEGDGTDRYLLPGEFVKRSSA